MTFRGLRNARFFFEVSVGAYFKKINGCLFFIAGIELLNSRSRSAGNIMIV